MGRKINRRVILEKAPFFILAIAFGVLAVYAQQTSGAIPDMEIYSFPKRIIFACYAFVMYLIKLAIPLNLSAFYPYPVRVGEVIPLIYYFFVFCCICLIGYVIYSLRHTKKIFFGIGFFAITVFLVLQLLPVGGAILADRYSYIPSIGIFYLVGEGINYLWIKRQKWIAIMAIGVFTILFLVKTHTRCGVWKDEMTLWNDVISQHQNIPFAYFNRGILYMNEQQFDLALADYNKAIELNPKYFHAYNNRGVFYRNDKRNNEAIEDFNMAIQLKPDNAEIYYNRGLVFMDENKNIEALTDFNKAIELKPDYADVYNDKGTVYFMERRFDDAIINYSKAIELNPLDSRAYYNRGLALYNSGKNEEACTDWKHAASKGYKPALDAYSKICK
jgi:tetratricopeptide (TPR) repeat protein